MRKRHKQHDETAGVPAASVECQQAIDSYLDYMLARLELSLDNHKVAQMQNPTAALAAQIVYIRAQVSTTKWLLAVNQQRKCHATSEGTRSTGV